MINTVFTVHPSGSITTDKDLPARRDLIARSNSLEASLTIAKNEAAHQGVPVIVHPVGYHWERSVAASFKPGDRVRHTGVLSVPTGTVVKGTPHASGQIWVHWDQDEGRSAVGGQIVRALPENLELLED